jgi:hypothetical protein
MYGDKFKYEDDVKFEFVMDNTKSLYYIYDLEDCWRVDITVLRVEAKGKNYPQLLSYEGGMAKEDCGGALGLAGEELEEVDKEYINLLFETAFLDMI